MPQVPQQNNAAAKDPAQLLSMIFREISGVFTAASRNAIPDDKVFNLENIIPIGPQNAVVVPNVSGTLVDYAADPIYWSQSCNLNDTEYLVNFGISGAVYFYNLSSGVSQAVNGSLVLSGSNSRLDQWENSAILFIDSSGYYSYDGTTFQAITGSGVPTSGDDIAVYAGRVWIVSGRVLFNSGAGDYTTPSWLPQNGAAFIILVDPQIRTKVQRMTVANGLLYLFAATAVNVISNVQVPIGSVPPTPVYQNTNIQTIIGTDQPASLFAYDRFAMFANRYGCYQLYGLNAPKVSDDINGTWRYLDFSQVISGGQVVVENILCAAFLIKRSGDPIFGSNTIIALWFQVEGKNRWWFSNFGPLTFIVSGFVNNVATLFGFVNNKLVQLYADESSAPIASVMTKLWPLEDDVAKKEAITVGFLADFSIFGSQMSLTVDTFSESRDSGTTIAVRQGQWLDSANQVLGFWINAAGVIGGWGATSSVLSFHNAPSMFDHNLGMTLTTVGYQYVLNFMAMDYKLRNRWT